MQILVPKSQCGGHMVEPLYLKEASYVIFIHAKFKNYSRTELLFI